MSETDVGDKAQVKSKKKKESLKREQEKEEIKQLLSTPYGRRFLWRLLERCHIHQSISFRDAGYMALMSGERDIGIWLIAQLVDADPQAYLKLVSEDTQGKKND